MGRAEPKLRNDDDFNLYAYVGNDPLNGTDPTGTEAAFVTKFSVCSLTGGPDCDAILTPYAEVGKAFPFAAAAEEHESGNYKWAVALGALDAASFGRGSALRSTMQAVGVRFLKGEVAHHVVAQGLKDQFSMASRELLKKFCIGIDEAVNGAKVPSWFHQGADNFLHGSTTKEAIFNRLGGAARNGVEAIRKELGTIGKEIEKAAKETKVCTTGSRICRWGYRSDRVAMRQAGNECCGARYGAGP